MKRSHLLIIASIILAGFGIYSFAYQRSENWWVVFLLAAILNIFLALRNKKSDN